MSGVPIRPPTEADGLTASEVAEWHRVQRVLEADPRTAGDANRPTWLEAGAAPAASPPVKRWAKGG